jgi:2'-5' RNA ligase
MPRLFTAIALPDEIDTELNQYISVSEQVSAQQTKHITLRFIGNVTETVAAKIEDDLLAVHVEPFELTIGGCQVFKPHGMKKILVANVAHHETLSRLYELIGEIVISQGVKVDQREYKPHITLTRLNQPSTELVGVLVKKASQISMSQAVTGFVLFGVDSNLKPPYVQRRVYRFND